MTTATHKPIEVDGDQAIGLYQISWEQSPAISDALVDRSQPRTIYLDGSLTLLTTSRRHDRYAEFLGILLVAVANVLEHLLRPRLGNGR